MSDIRVTKISREAAEVMISKLDNYQERVVLSAYFDILLCDMDDYHAYIEKILGRPIMTAELQGEKIKNEIKEAATAEAEVILNKLKS